MSHPSSSLSARVEVDKDKATKKGSHIMILSIEMTYVSNGVVETKWQALTEMISFGLPDPCNADLILSRVCDGTFPSQYIVVGPRTSISVQFHKCIPFQYGCNQRRHLMCNNDRSRRCCKVDPRSLPDHTRTHATGYLPRGSNSSVERELLRHDRLHQTLD